MSKAPAGSQRTVTAVMGNDGKVYFEFQLVPKSLVARIPDWAFVSLSLLVVSLVTAAAFLI